jgi:D-glycero-D-manno-heptose 1,7-bisphosphate phosphatase
MGKNKALFLDRDGVINVDRGYVHCRDEFQFQEGIFELCGAAQALGYLLVVVTNQAGIARGFYTEAEFHELTTWMTRRFAEEHIEIARVYYCPYHPVHGLGSYRYDSPDRKPNPGMILRASADFDLDLTASLLLGDHLSDIQAGKAAGVGTTILLRHEPVAHDVPSDPELHVASSLGEVLARFFRRPATDGAGDSRRSLGFTKSSTSEPAI